MTNKIQRLDIKEAVLDFKNLFSSKGIELFLYDDFYIECFYDEGIGGELSVNLEKLFIFVLRKMNFKDMSLIPENLSYIWIFEFIAPYLLKFNMTKVYFQHYDYKFNSNEFIENSFIILERNNDMVIKMIVNNKQEYFCTIKKDI